MYRLPTYSTANRAKLTAGTFTVPLDIWNEIGYFGFLYCVILFVLPYTERSQTTRVGRVLITYHDTVQYIIKSWLNHARGFEQRRHCLAIGLPCAYRDAEDATIPARLRSAKQLCTPASVQRHLPTQQTTSHLCRLGDSK